ncbi:MAG: hypothetical protein B9S32_10220 [Verrucomicrobia bacterium Tous-C9LFEB]|nr:MAG: hypothetical protein B9S32_10220 [Verrucomicrobia bacterium Tous-C9LFEB]
MAWPQANTFRSRTNYLLACSTELASPFLKAYARHYATAAPSSPRHWRKAILLGANHIGDLLYRSASLAALQRGLPECRFDYAAPSPANEVLEGNPAIHRIQPLEHPPAPGSAEFKSLRAENYDAAICYDTGSYLSWLKLAVQLGIPNRVGYVHKGFSAWVTYPITLHYPQPFPAYFRDLVSQLTGQPADWSLRPQVFPTVEDECAAMALWQEFDLNETVPVLACFVTTRQPTGVWPTTRILETLRLVHTGQAIQIVLCGAKLDAATLQALSSVLGLGCHLNAGRLGLRAMVAFLRNCRAAFTTDSGPRHLANAAGIPAVFLRNLRSMKIETGVYLDSEYDLAPDRELISPEKQAEAFARVSAAEVSRQLTEILNRP